MAAASATQTATTTLILLHLFLLLLLPRILLVSSGEAGKSVLKLQDLNRNQKTTNIHLSTSCLSQKSRHHNGATILEVIHRDHCSGGHPTTNWTEEARKRLILDDARVRSLQSQIKSSSAVAVVQLGDHGKLLDDDINISNNKSRSPQIPLSSGIRLQTLNYIVTVQLGGRKMSVIVDTGSDLTWVQCQPCRVCYTQQDPIFNPSVSLSYKSVPCNSSTCQSLPLDTGNQLCGVGGGVNGGPNNNACNYAVSYGDGSYTRGELGLETLTLGATPVNNFVFGCGRNNKGLFGGASGLMGLGRSAVSLVSQTSSVFGGVFSYCLPSPEVAASSGSLAFGGGDSSVLYGIKNSTPISYTDMIPNLQLPTFYFLNLTGVSVGQVPLEYSSDNGKAAGGGGILIDSGTVITRLPPSIYRPLKAEFLKQFSGFPTAPSFSILDTCFNLSSYQEVDIPDIRMHFSRGAELAVDVTGVLYFAKSDASQVCLAMASLTYEDDVGIIGNYQQKSQRVIYDTKGSRLGFAREPCSFT